MKQRLKTLSNKFSKADFKALRAQYSKYYVPLLFMSPGIGCGALGFCAVLYPQLRDSFLALLCIFMGAFLSFIGWKIFQLKVRMDGYLKGLQATIILQSNQLRNVAEASHVVRELEETDENGKKIVVH